MECNDAKNSLEYKLFSEYIKDHDKKYCTNFCEQCKDFYKNCEDVVDMDKCSVNVKEGFYSVFVVLIQIINMIKIDCSQFNKPSSTLSDDYYKFYVKTLILTVHILLTYVNMRKSLVTTHNLIDNLLPKMKKRYL